MILGHVIVIDRRPIPGETRNLAIFEIFSARATAELRRYERKRRCVREKKR